MNKLATQAQKPKKPQPKPVKKVYCPKCGELQLKIYPWSSYQISEETIKQVVCVKCKSK